ncbi:hypothetical protein [Streptomyces sp. G-G2]|uniref:hypothetical protein n=1 Tax=Streptomyces sp. G-G2 TaxID=3046201 RepID=UPI0024B970EF|nr:hypothetical protein [Streptomyces sp. G-G2]MDJ0380633.1 hypothetical protein [Streptomyces sp. G-G2]
MEPHTHLHAQELKKDLDATLRARGELGPEYESALVDSFVEKVDTQVRRRLAEQRLAEARGPGAVPGAGSFGERFGFAIVTLVLAIPLSAVAVVNAGLTGLLISWAGILGVTFAHTRPRPTTP